MKENGLFLLCLFVNPWIWRIYNTDLIIFLIVLGVTNILYKLLKSFSRTMLVYFITPFLILGFLQWKTTIPQSLTLLDNDEQRIQKMRLSFYNPSSHYMRLLFYKLDLKNFLEGDFSTASFRLQKNLFESLDLNIYFFAGHPRERVWSTEFEKFPFIFLIPFIIGLYRLWMNKKLFYVFFSASLIFLSIVGHKNNLGPFILLPLMVVTTTVGIYWVLGYLKINKLKRWQIYILFLFVILSVLQSFIYAF